MPSPTLAPFDDGVIGGIYLDPPVNTEGARMFFNVGSRANNYPYVGVPPNPNEEPLDIYLFIGFEDLPPEDVQLVKDTLAQMLSGEFDRFDLFSGPIIDNQGNVIVPDGERMEQSDLDQFPPGAPGLECKYCMYWWADGITAELPEQ